MLKRLPAPSCCWFSTRICSALIAIPLSAAPFLTALSITTLICSPANLHAQATAGPAANPAPATDQKITALITQLDKVQTISETAISPDGSRLAWVLAGRDGDRIQVAPMSDPGKPETIRAGSSPEGCQQGNIAWSPDSASLAFTSDCESKGQADIYLASIGPSSNSAPKRLTRLHGLADGLTFSPDGKQIGFLYVEGATRRAGALDAMKPWSGVIGVEGVEIQRVAAAYVASGELRQLTPPTLHVYEYDWSPDSKQLAYVAAPPPGENNWWVAQLYSEPIGGEPRSLVDTRHLSGPLHGLQLAVPRWSPDGQQIGFIGGLMSDQGATGGDIYLVPASGGEPRDATPGRKATPAWFTWIDNGVLGITEIAGGSAHLFGYDLQSMQESPESNLTLPASIGDGRLEMSVSVARNNDIAFISSSFEAPPEVWAGPLTSLRQMTHVNDGLKPAWGRSESTAWQSPIGGSASGDFDVQGWLLYPANYDPAKKYPMIVFVHGGPSSAALPRWPSAGFGAAPFSAEGYFVLMPNPRGSYGQGEKFTQANVKDFGYGDLHDILAGVDAVEKRLPVDDHRLGLTGWSYGGFMTMFGVTQTQRFRAAVAGAGISDWQSYYGENSIDQWMVPFFGASVYDDPAIYARSSAIDFIKQVKTPTLVVVGDRDGECPAPQSFEFWHALRAEHVPTELVVYPNEGHRFVSPEHRRDVLERALGWFQQYMTAQ